MTDIVIIHCLKASCHHTEITVIMDAAIYSTRSYLSGNLLPGILFHRVFERRKKRDDRETVQL